MNINFSGLNFSRIFKTIIFLFLLYYVYAFTYQIWNNIKYENGYTLGDWLINYEDGGFKRRGLSGSLFIKIYDLFDLPIKKSVFFIQSFLNGVFVLYFFLIFRKKYVGLNFFLLILTPCAFLYFFIEPGTIGRKEIILYSLYSFYLYRLSNKKINIWELFYPFLIIIPLGILLHELIFFYLPFFIVPLITIDKGRFNRRQIIEVVIVFFVLTTLVVGALFFYGGEINQGHTFDILESKGISNKMRNLGNLGILTWNDNFDKIQYFEFNNYYKYIYSFLLGFLVFVFFVFLGNTKFKNKEFIISFLITFIISLPIYILAIDWGRWLNIQFIMSFLLLTYSLNVNKIEVKSFILYRVAFLVLCVVLILFWRFELVDKGFIIYNIFSRSI